MEVDVPASASNRQDDMADGRRPSPAPGQRPDTTASTLHKTALLQSREGLPTPLPTSIPTNLSPKHPPHSPRGHRGPEERSSRSDAAPMPPPSAPSQTASAQELRETARQSIRRNEEQADSRPIPTEARGDARGELPSSSSGLRRRSQSPPTRPGTRNPSTESRGSGERVGDRGEVDRADDRRLERESSRQDTYASDRREHRRARSERDRDRERGRGDEKDRDRESRKDREVSGRTVLSAEDRSQSARAGHRSAAPAEDILGKRRRLADDDVCLSTPQSLALFLFIASCMFVLTVRPCFQAQLS